MEIEIIRNELERQIDQQERLIEEIKAREERLKKMESEEYEQ